MQQIKSNSALTVQNSVGYLSQRYTAATEDRLLPLTASGAGNNPQGVHHIAQQGNNAVAMLLAHELHVNVYIYI